MEEFIKKYDRFVKQWSDVFNWVAVAGIAAMLCITVFDIVSSKLFRQPLLGSMDIIGLLGLVVVSFALARTEVFRQHVRIDFLIVGFKDQIQGIIGIVSSVLALILIGLLIWRSVEYGISMHATKIGSPTLRIPFFPFSFVIALGCIPLFLILLQELFESARKALKK